MLADAFAGDDLVPRTSNASSILFPVPLAVPFVDGDWKGSYEPPDDGAADGVPHGDEDCCACDVGVDQGSLLGISKKYKTARW